MIVDSPVGMPGRAIRNRFLEEKESRRESIKKCYQCIVTCNPANTPYCITRALVHAAKGETDDALLFCGENASFLKNRDFIAGNLETEYNKNSEDLHRWNEKRSITVKNQAVMNIWVKKEQEDICNVLG